MTTLTESAYAKLNLTLDVLGKRADGYHDLRSVMQTISLCDDVTVDLDTGRPWSLSCTEDELPTDEHNLAWKAARVYCEALHKQPDGVHIHIVKRIPQQAGLGGGSADAAAVLRALNRHYGSPLHPLALAELGARVGSDVPFCTLMGTAMAEGRGERLRPLPKLPRCVFVVVKPDFSVSTPELYRALDEAVIAVRPDADAMERAIRAGNIEGVAAALCNVFEPVVADKHPEVEEIKAVFRVCGAAGRMTGSGSALFAIAAGEKQAAAIRDRLTPRWPRTFIAETV